jgi:hypothetical protein
LLSAAAPIAWPLTHHAAVVPLVGQRQAVHAGGAPFQMRPGPVSRQAAIVPGAPAPAGVPARAAGGTVQRSFADHPATSDPGGRATGWTAGLAAADRAEPPAAHVDPGAIAVARGLAHREPDGSVVFDLRPSLTLARQAPPMLPHRDLPGSPYTLASPLRTVPSDTVQRQEDDAGPMDSPVPAADSKPPPVGLPAAAAPAAVTASAASSASAAPVAPAPPGPPLDELARQLFGPLAARLKAELRLDRERAGLLTDLRR